MRPTKPRLKKPILARCTIQRFTMNSPQTHKEKNRKGGRPKKPEDELRIYPVKVYFDEANFRKLQNRSKRTGLSLSCIVYDLAINCYIKEPISREEITLLRSLSGMANNLNQLARQANTYGFQAAAVEVSEVVGKIDRLLIRISEK